MWLWKRWDLFDSQNAQDQGMNFQHHHNYIISTVLSLQKMICWILRIGRNGTTGTKDLFELWSNIVNICTEINNKSKAKQWWHNLVGFPLTVCLFLALFLRFGITSQLSPLLVFNTELEQTKQQVNIAWLLPHLQ